MGPLVKGNVLFKHGEVLWRTSGVMHESELLASYARKGMVQEINFLGTPLVYVDVNKYYIELKCGRGTYAVIVFE